MSKIVEDIIEYLKVDNRKSISEEEILSFMGDTMNDFELGAIKKILEKRKISIVDNMEDTECPSTWGTYLQDISGFKKPTKEESLELGRRIYAGREVAGQHSDEPEIEKELRRIERDGELARDELVQRSLRLTIPIASRYSKKMADKNVFLDLIQEGNVGLLTAANKYDYRKGFNFSTYAMWWVRQKMQRYILGLNKWGITEKQMKKLQSINKYREEFIMKNGFPPTNLETSQALGINMKVLADLDGMNVDIISFDALVATTEGDLTVEDMIEDNNAPQENDIIQRLELRAYLIEKFRTKFGDSDLFEFVIARYGFDESNTPRTLQDTAAYLGWSYRKTQHTEVEVFVELKMDFELLEELREYTLC